MSDTKNLPFTDQQLKDALHKLAMKTGEAACPFCGNTLWAYESARPGQIGAVPEVAHVMMTNHAIFGPAPSIPGITLTCSECGFVRVHSLPTLLKGTQNGN